MMISRHGRFVLAILLSITAAWGQSPQEQQAQAARKKEIIAILREAAALVPKIPTNNQPSDAANIAGAQTQAGDLEGALATSRSFDGASKLALPLMGIAYALASQGRLPEALRIIAASEDEQGKVGVYHQMTGALNARGDFEGALSVARLMSGDRYSYTSAMLWICTAQFKAGRQDGASATLRDVLAFVESEPKQPATERAGLYMTITDYLARAGDEAEARQVAQRIEALVDQEKDSGAKNALLPFLARAYADIGDFPIALRILRSSKRKSNDGAFLEAIAWSQARHGYAAEALATIEELGGATTDGGSAYQGLAGLFAETGDYPAARAAIDRIPEPDRRAYTLAIVANEEVDKAPGEAGFTVHLAWSAAQELLKDQKKLSPGTLMLIAATQARLGDTGGALEIIGRLDGNERAWALENLMEKMVAEGNTAYALRLARSQQDPEARACSLQWAARAMLDQLKQAPKKVN